MFKDKAVSPTDYEIGAIRCPYLPFGRKLNNFIIEITIFLAGKAKCKGEGIAPQGKALSESESFAKIHIYIKNE